MMSKRINTQPGNDDDVKIVIRDAQHKDAEEIAQLLGELGYPNTAAFVLGKIKKLGGRRRDRILVAEKDFNIVGVLSLHIMPLLHKKGNLCRISALVVSKKYRGQYIGQRLMEMAEVYGQANDCSIVEITSSEKRIDAHSFYTQLGYVVSSKRFIKSLNDHK